MAKLNLKQFILLIDGGQPEETQIYLTVNGEVITSGTLGQAQELLNNLQSPFIVKSFNFASRFIEIECEL